MRLMDDAESASDVARIGQLKKNVKRRDVFVYLEVMKIDTPQDFLGKARGIKITLETTGGIKRSS